MSIHQEVTFPAAPERVYELLTDGMKFAATKGKPAKINAPRRHAGWAAVVMFAVSVLAMIVPMRRALGLDSITALCSE